jgi:hypothetical protein
MAAVALSWTGDIGHALDEMKRAGAVLLKSGDL